MARRLIRPQGLEDAGNSGNTSKKQGGKSSDILGHEEAGEGPNGKLQTIRRPSSATNYTERAFTHHRRQLDHVSSRPSSSPGIFSLVTLSISLYGAGTVQIRSNRSSGYLTFPFTPRASAILASSPCSQQIRMFPGPWYDFAALAAPWASFRLMESSIGIPSSLDRGVTVS
jgi:hypothetical protein